MADSNNSLIKKKTFYINIIKDTYNIYSTGIGQALIIAYFSYLLITELFIPTPISSKVLWVVLDIIIIGYFSRIEYLIAIRKVKEKNNVKFHKEQIESNKKII
jgi:hypothetical protein